MSGESFDYSSLGSIEVSTSKNFHDNFRRHLKREKIDVNKNVGDIVIQQLEVDFITKTELHEFMNNSYAVLRIFGCTLSGQSVLANVYGFLPYFFIKMTDKLSNSEDCKSFIQDFDNIIVKDSGNKVTKAIIDYEVVTGASIYHYHNNSEKFLKIYLSSPKLISASRRLLEQGITCCEPIKFFTTDLTYETNIDFEVRFMVDVGMVGSCWISIPAGKYNQSLTKSSYCQIEIDVNWKNLQCHAPEDNWDKIAPMRVLSFDIECSGRKGQFPDPELDSVIQISSCLQNYGETEPFHQTVFTLNTCAPLSGADIVCFATEDELLRSWATFVRDVDPDVITGYNICNFDLPYLLSRANHMNIYEFAFLGRIKAETSTVRSSAVQSKALGRRDNKLIDIPGRVQIDVMQILLREYKLRSYSLNNVSFHFLGEQKEDVHYSIITDLHNGSDFTRRRLAMYCLKDSLLPLKLLDKLMLIINLVEMARVTGVPLNFLLIRGQQVKVIAQILRIAKPQNYLLPALKGEAGDEFTGAIVIEPMKGYYKLPISTLDFNSLYPSIMIAHNLCYTTLIPPGFPVDKFFTKDDYVTTPIGHRFIKPHVRTGILPYILQNLLDARKRVKAALKVETDPLKRKVLDGRQLALKISANSVYGFTGAQVGKLPCLEISSSVTAFGREMIELTKGIVENEFSFHNPRCPKGVQVIYGDTDSVMVKFGIESIADCMELGKEAAAFISSKFVSPIKLEFEKVYFPYLLINKKRYAGLLYTQPDKYDKIDCKGIETVRRDNCPLVAELINTCLMKILIDRDPTGAINHAKSTISDLLCNRIDISKLVISKELSKTGDEYSIKQVHSELAERMRLRDPGSAPKLGDRVPYVIIDGTKKDRAYERAEDPLYVLEHSLPIDTKYYLKNQLANPLTRLFEPILGEKAAETLLNGEHTRYKTQVRSTIGSLARFTQVTNSCVGCKTSLTSKSKQIEDPNMRDDYKDLICGHCVKHLASIYHKEILTNSELEESYASLWTQCQRCQGSLLGEILCTNRDCPIFYMRVKVQKDLNQHQKVLSRFKKVIR